MAEAGRLFSSPDPAVIGDRCAHLLPRGPDVLRRHVERFDIVSADVVRRSLTVDVDLPGVHASVGVTPSGAYRYFIPFALMAKWPAIGNIDLRDEDGRSLPLLNERDGVVITQHALRGATLRMLGVQPDASLSAPLRSLLDQVVAHAGPHRDVALSVTRAVIRSEFKADPETLQLFEGLLSEVAFNNVVWLELHGHPGDRRVAKFSYDAHRFERGFDDDPTPRAPVVLQHDVGVVQPAPYVEPGAGNPRTQGYRWRWLTRRLGLMATDIVVFDLCTSGCERYHLDVAPPPGLDVLEIRWRPKPGEDGGPGELERAEIAPWNRERAQLYMEGTEPGFVSDALLTVRPGPLGVLSRTAAATSAAALMLWLYHADWKSVKKAAENGEEPGALLLLVVSSLLALAVVPRVEHPIASAVLYGMRSLGLISAGLAVVSAAAIFGVTLGELNLERTLHWSGVGASAVALFAILAWALSFRRVWRSTRDVREAWRRPRAYVLFGAWPALLATIVVGLFGWLAPGAVHGLVVPLLLFLILALLAALQAFAAGHRQEVQGWTMIAASRLIGANGAVTGGAAIFLALELVDSGLPLDWSVAWKVASVLLLILALLTLVWPQERASGGRDAATRGSGDDDRAPGGKLRALLPWTGAKTADPLSEQRRERARVAHLPASSDISVLSAQAEPYIAQELEDAAEEFRRRVQEALAERKVPGYAGPEEGRLGSSLPGEVVIHLGDAAA